MKKSQKKELPSLKELSNIVDKHYKEDGNKEYGTISVIAKEIFKCIKV